MNTIDNSNVLIIYALIILLAYNWLYKSAGLLKDGQVIIFSMQDVQQNVSIYICS